MEIDLSTRIGCDLLLQVPLDTGARHSSCPEFSEFRVLKLSDSGTHIKLKDKVSKREFWIECHTVYAKLVDTIQDDEDSCFR